MWLMQVAFAFGRKVLNKKPITICIYIVAPTEKLKKMWRKGFDDWYTYDEDILYEWQNLVHDEN